MELAEAALGEATQLGAVTLSEVNSRSFEVEMELSAAQPGLVVAHSEDKSTRTLVYVSASGDLVVDRSLSAGKDSVIAKELKVNTSTVRAPLSATQSGTHKLRLFMDNSVLEIFVNDLVALSTRIYPDAQDTGVSVLVHPDAGAAGEVRIWQGLDKAVVA